mgnify:CR=1 FL=1
MMRIACLLGLLFTAACDPGSDAEGKVPGNPPPVKSGQPDAQVPVSPPTGVVRIQEAHDLYKQEVAAIEKALEADQAPNPNQVRTLRQIQVGIEHLTVAARMGRDNQSRENLRNAHGMLLDQQAKLLLKRRQIWVEITEIEQYLSEIEKGTGSPPAGFTEPELRDRLTDAQKRDKEIQAQEEEIRATMAKYEEQLGSGRIESEERSLFTDELEGLERLNARIEALLSRTS